MFGLRDGEDNKQQPFVFELEKELKDPKTAAEVKARVEGRIREIKKILREGEDSKGFEDFGLLLHGYDSLHKVIDRIVEKKTSH